MASRLNFSTGAIVNPLEGLQQAVTSVGSVFDKYVQREQDREDRLAREAREDARYDERLRREDARNLILDQRYTDELAATKEYRDQQQKNWEAKYLIDKATAEQQAKVTGMQIAEAENKIASDKAYLGLMKDPEQSRIDLLASTDAAKAVRAPRTEIDKNIEAMRAAGASEAEIQAAESALPAVLKKEMDAGTKKTIAEIVGSTMSKQDVQDAARSRLAGMLGRMPTQEQVDTYIGSAGVDMTKLQERQDKLREEQAKHLTPILTTALGQRGLSALAGSNKLAGLDEKDVSGGEFWSTYFGSSKDNFAGTYNAAKQMALQDGIIPADKLDQALSVAALAGVQDYDAEGKAQFRMDPAKLLAVATKTYADGSLDKAIKAGAGGAQISVKDAMDVLSNVYEQPTVRSSLEKEQTNRLNKLYGEAVPSETEQAGMLRDQTASMYKAVPASTVARAPATPTTNQVVAAAKPEQLLDSYRKALLDNTEYSPKTIDYALERAKKSGNVDELNEMLGRRGGTLTNLLNNASIMAALAGNYITKNVLKDTVNYHNARLQGWLYDADPTQVPEVFSTTNNTNNIETAVELLNDRLRGSFTKDYSAEGQKRAKLLGLVK